MNAPFKVGLIRASLPSYFPERHQIWDRAQAALESLCAQLDTQLYLASDLGKYVMGISLVVDGGYLRI